MRECEREAERGSVMGSREGRRHHLHNILIASEREESGRVGEVLKTCDPQPHAPHTNTTRTNLKGNIPNRWRDTHSFVSPCLLQTSCSSSTRLDTVCAQRRRTKSKMSTRSRKGEVLVHSRESSHHHGLPSYLKEEVTRR